MSYIGNTPGVSSQRVVLEEVVSGSPKSTFIPLSGYILGYVDVLINGHELDTSDFTAPDGVNINLIIPAAVGDTVKVKTWLPRGLSDGYLKTEADARFSRVDTASQGLTTQQQTNARTNINALNKGGGDTLGGTTFLDNQVPFLLIAGGNNGTFDKTAIYYANNNTSNSSSNGVFIEMGKLSDNSSAETRRFVVGARGGAKNFEIDGVGNTWAAGNFVVSNGKGIDFSANANVSGTTSEVLGDYEEGTWTPVSNSTNFTCSVNSAYYRKIGRQVFVWCYLAITNNTGSAQGSWNCGGLPYQSVDGYAPAGRYYGQTPYAGMCYVEGGSTYIIDGNSCPTGAFSVMLWANYAAAA